MVEHWYEFLPAAWFFPKGRWIVILTIIIIFTIGFLVGFLLHIVKTNHWLIKRGYKPSEFLKND